jgi:hypothetical protein
MENITIRVKDMGKVYTNINYPNITQEFLMENMKVIGLTVKEKVRVS